MKRALRVLMITIMAVTLGGCATLDAASKWACGEELKLFDGWTATIKPFRTPVRQAEVITAHTNIRLACSTGVSVVSIYALYTNIKELMK